MLGSCIRSRDYHAALRELTRKHGTLLIIDETHTICAGPGGYTRAENLEPDVLVFGKAIGGGIPGAAYGFSQEVADRIIAGQSRQRILKTATWVALAALWRAMHCRWRRCAPP